MVEQVGLRSQTALCVVRDDDAFELLRLELLHRGYRAVRADSASAALQAARTGEYSIHIIEDSWLLEADGVELWREIRDTCAAIPTLVYRANLFPGQMSVNGPGSHGYSLLPDLTADLPSVEELVEAAGVSTGAIVKCLFQYLQSIEEARDVVADQLQLAATHLDAARQRIVRAHASARSTKLRYSR